MPYELIKISPRRYQVINSETGVVHAKHSTLKNAKAQIRLLDSLEGGALTGKEVKKLTKASYEKGKARPAKIGDLELDKSLTTREAAVYHNPKTGEAVVTHRGTQGASDWLNNLALGVGLYKKTDRYAKGKDVQKKVNAKYGKDKVITTAHSQSGALVHELIKEGLVNKSIEVNPARLPFQKVMKNETIIKSSGDPVSIFVPKDKNVKVIKSKTYNPLLEHSAKIIKGAENEKLYGGCFCMEGGAIGLAKPRYVQSGIVTSEGVPIEGYQSGGYLSGGSLRLTMPFFPIPSRYD